MNRTELTDLHKRTCDKAREIQVAKNHDYAHEGDIFRNFRRYGTFGVLVRLGDKLARLDSFEENKEFAVADEKLEDTVIDIINYSTIYLAMTQEARPEPQAIQQGPYNGKIAIHPGPFCGCERIAKYRLDRNNEDTEYFCEYCVRGLRPADQASATLMETA